MSAPDLFGAATDARSRLSTAGLPSTRAGTAVVSVVPSDTAVQPRGRIDYGRRV